MRKRTLFAAVAAFTLIATPASAGALDPLKVKVKPGLYDIAVQLEAPGEKPQSSTMKSCTSERDMDKGVLFGDGESGSSCEVRGFTMSGDTATYSVACKGKPVFVTDHKVSVTGGGFNAVSTTKVDGKAVMTTRAQAKYAGPCK
jgi:hypothetical protein